MSTDRVLFSLALALLATPLAAAEAAGDPAGLWRTPVDGGRVALAPCGAELCGRVVTSARLKIEPAQTDVRNRDPAQRGRAIRGLLILRLRPAGPGRWNNGWVYNPSDGGTYKGSMELTADGRLRLKGCVVAPFCQTQTWTRADGPGG